MSEKKKKVNEIKWRRKWRKGEGARRIGKSRKYALERSVSFAISGVCIRLDAHQVVHEFRKGESGARRYGSLRSQRDVAPVRWDTRISPG